MLLGCQPATLLRRHAGSRVVENPTLDVHPAYAGSSAYLVTARGELIVDRARP